MRRYRSPSTRDIRSVGERRQTIGRGLREVLNRATLNALEEFTPQLDLIAEGLEKLAGRLEIKSSNERIEIEGPLYFDVVAADRNAAVIRANRRLQSWPARPAFWVI